MMPRGPFRQLVVLGESTVQGGGWVASDKERYADILWRLVAEAQEQPLGYRNARLGASVISPTSPGYAASAKPSAAEQLDAEVLAAAPDLLVIAYGLNDMRAGMAVDDFRAELVKLLSRVQARLNPAIVLVNVYYMTAYDHFPPFDRGSPAAALAYNRMLAELARERGLIYADVHGGAVDCPHVLHLDTVHANKLGNLLIAHRVFEAIVRGCPGLAANMNRRDETTEWTRLIRPRLATGREQSEKSRPEGPAGDWRRQRKPGDPT